MIKENENKNEVEQVIVPYSPEFEDPQKANELAARAAKFGQEGVAAIYHLSNLYTELAVQRARNSVTENKDLDARRFQKIADNLLEVGLKAEAIIEMFDPASATNTLFKRRGAVQ